MARLTIAVHDPGRASLRKAARTAIVMPPLFALGLVVLDEQQMAMLSAFGAMAMLAFADFGGPPRRRAGAYVGLTVVGLPLIAVATLVGDSPWLAAIVMAAVAFAIAFVGVFGGYFAAGGVAAILAFVLSVAVPATVEEIPWRLAGWALAGVASTAAALVLWPRFERERLLRLASAASSRIAELLRSMAGGVGADPTAAREAVAALQAAYDSTPYRPAGPTRRDQAIVFLVAELRRSVEFAEEAGRTNPTDARDRELLAVSAETFDAVGATLASGSGTIHLEALERQRAVQLEAMTQEAARIVGGEEALSGLEEPFSTRIVSYIALSAAVNAQLVNGIEVETESLMVSPLAPSPGAGGTAHRLRRLMSTHLRGDSVWFQAALRTAVGLGIAVLIALLARLDHAFWVLLGTLSVLRSSAVTTWYTAWQALLGTIAGFGLSSAYLAAGGGGETALWVALPLCVFLAVYTPTAIHAAVGQAMFTLTVVVLFSLIQPDGWRTGLVRVEDILIGCGTATLVGLALWPRGAGGQLRASVAVVFETCSTYVVRAARLGLGRASEDETGAARDAAGDAGRRGHEALTTYLNERGPKRLPPQVYASLLTAGAQLRFVGDALLVRAQTLGALAPSQRPGEVAVDAAVGELGSEIVQVGRSLQGNGRASRAAVASPASRPEEITLDGFGSADALMATWTAEWIRHGHRILTEIEAPLAEARADSGRPWWR